MESTVCCMWPTKSTKTSSLCLLIAEPSAILAEFPRTSDHKTSSLLDVKRSFSEERNCTPYVQVQTSRAKPQKKVEQKQSTYQAHCRCRRLFHTKRIQCFSCLFVFGSNKPKTHSHKIFFWEFSSSFYMSEDQHQKISLCFLL